MTTFDVHQHLWPPAVVELLTRRRRPPCISEGTVRIPGRAAFPFDEAQGDAGSRLAQLDAEGIDVAVVSLSPTDCFDAELREAWHDGIARSATGAGGRLLPLAAGRAAPGFAGVCISAADVIAFRPLAGLGGSRREVLFVHPGRVGATPGRCRPGGRARSTTRPRCRPPSDLAHPAGPPGRCPPVSFRDPGRGSAACSTSAGARRRPAAGRLPAAVPRHGIVRRRSVILPRPRPPAGWCSAATLR